MPLSTQIFRFKCQGLPSLHMFPVIQPTIFIRFMSLNLNMARFFGSHFIKNNLVLEFSTSFYITDSF